MATKQTSAKTVTSPLVQTPESANVERLKSQRAELDAQIKAAGAETRRLRAEQKAASVKSLAQVVSEQEAAMTASPWMARHITSMVAQRIKAGQDRDSAIEALLDLYRQHIVMALDWRAEQRATQKNAPKA